MSDPQKNSENVGVNFSFSRSDFVKFLLVSPQEAKQLSEGDRKKWLDLQLFLNQGLRLLTSETIKACQTGVATYADLGKQQVVVMQQEGKSFIFPGITCKAIQTEWELLVAMGQECAEKQQQGKIPVVQIARENDQPFFISTSCESLSAVKKTWESQPGFKGLSHVSYVDASDSESPVSDSLKEFLTNNSSIFNTFFSSALYSMELSALRKVVEWALQKAELMSEDDAKIVVGSLQKIICWGLLLWQSPMFAINVVGAIQLLDWLPLTNLEKTILTALLSDGGFVTFEAMPERLPDIGSKLLHFSVGVGGNVAGQALVATVVATVPRVWNAVCSWWQPVPVQQANEPADVQNNDAMRLAQ